MRSVEISGLFLLLGSSCFSGCKNQAPPVADMASGVARPSAAAVSAGAPAPEPTAATAAAATAAASKYSEAGFDLVIQPKGSYASGQVGEAEIILTAKPPFHVNDKYPYKFKVSESPGLKFANLVVTKDLVKLEPARATVPVAFTPDSAGKHTLAGQLSFSVCTADQCMIEKRELALAIEAK